MLKHKVTIEIIPETAGKYLTVRVIVGRANGQSESTFTLKEDAINHGLRRALDEARQMVLETVDQEPEGQSG